MAAFGPNEWLVDELYQQYLKDRSTVDKAWWEFFEDYTPAELAPTNGQSGVSDDTDPGPGTPAAETPVERSAPPVPPDAPAPPAPPAPPAAPAAASPVPAASPAASAPPASAPPASAPPASAPPAAEAPAAAARRPAAKAPPATGRRQPGTCCAQHASTGRQGRPPSRPPRPATRPTSARCAARPRGWSPTWRPASTCPTATSVRAVPAKLLIDNRIVINSHLKRGRGGKVSFTHLIGYAVVQALAAMPEMNYGYVEVDGKPARRAARRTSTSASPSTWPSRTARRQLLVPSIKGAESMDFAQFWAGYEDVVRRARAQQAHRRRLRRHHDQPDEPGHHRHRPLGAAADGRPGHDRRRRRDGVPGRVAGRQRGDARTAARSARS